MKEKEFCIVLWLGISSFPFSWHMACEVRLLLYNLSTGLIISSYIPNSISGSLLGCAAACALNRKL